jgi:hypothetical protein
MSLYLFLSLNGGDVYQILTGLLPFHEIRSNVTVMSKIIQGMKPTKPSFGRLELSIEIWAVMYDCWNPNPDERPRLRQVTDALCSVDTPELTTQRRQAWGNEHGISASLQSRHIQPTSDSLRNSQFTAKDAVVLAKYMVSIV